MKILHTSDLHYGKQWQYQSLVPDQERVLDEIFGMCEEHEVDLLLITGDILSDRPWGNRPARTARNLLARLRAPLKAGRAVLLLRGNHDPLDLFGLLSELMAEIARCPELPLVIANLPGVYSIPDHSMQVIALPYVSPSQLKADESLTRESPEGQIVGLSGLLSQLLRRMYTRVDPSRPSVFAGHVMIGGAEMRKGLEAEMTYSKELLLSPNDLPHFTSYNALGHIHLCQRIIAAAKPTWYPGVPQPLDMGEREYTPRLLLVTTPDEPGGQATVEQIPIRSAAPWIDRVLDGEAEVARFCEEVGTSDPLGRIAVKHIPTSQRAMIAHRVRGHAPRIDLRWADEEVTAGEPFAAQWNPQDVRGTVRLYIERAFPNEADQNRLLQAFESIAGEMGEVRA